MPNRHGGQCDPPLLLLLPMSADILLLLLTTGTTFLGDAMEKIDVETARQGTKFRYKYKKYKSFIDPDDEFTLTVIMNLAANCHSAREASAIMGVSPDAFYKWLERYENVRDAWDRGKELGKGRVRQILNMHAEECSSTARYLANNILGFSNNPNGSSPKALPPSAADGGQVISEGDGDVIELSREELKSRIQELLSLAHDGANDTVKPSKPADRKKRS